MSGLDVGDAPRPRLCHLKKWPDFQGYGFNLHAEKGKVGQYIGKVDEGSPSAVTGLKENDRIVEVNGVNVGNENHQQVVERIKANPNETKLLVVDKETDDYYKEKKMVIRSDQPNVEIRECPDTRLGSAGVTTVSASGPPAVNGMDKERQIKPRLCVLRIKPDFQGFGFNLHAEKGKPGQFIGKVDPGSPAEVGGLQEGDHIVEINDENISDQSHADVVNRIKSSPNMVRMLVVSGDDWTYAQENDIHVHHGMPFVEVIDPGEPTAKASESVVEKAEIAPVAAVAAAAGAGVAAISSSSISEDGPQPRHCFLKRWSDFDGYGFNLHAEKGQSGHFIGTVDDNSPASLSGLKQGDKIVEVNGDNVWNESHQVVVQKIKADPDAVSLLVLDPEAEEYYTAKSITVNSNMSNVKNIYGPASRPSADVQVNQTESVITSTAPVAAAAAVASSAFDSNAPRPRLCHLKQWPDFQGYGFNLHVEKGRAGHFIGAVDDNSPAFHSGMRKGDRIVEVNGINVWEASHADTVSTIKSRPDNVELLVVDPAAEEYYRNKGHKVHGGQDNIERIVCPDKNPATSSVGTVAPAAPAAVATSAVAATQNATSSLPSDAPRPRLCILKKRPDFQGYGFNLMVIKDRPGNYIGNIEKNSPAHQAGLLENDKIIEVNGQNILQEPHANVVNKIKGDPNQVSLLVVDPKADDYYQNNNLTVSSTQANVERIESSSTSVTPAAPAAVAAVIPAAVTMPSAEHAPRICIIRRWPDFQGYGFNLQAAKNREGNYIGGVDAGSPAYYGGLKDGDRIVEVNGTPAYTEPHNKVVSLITQDPKEVKLAVVDRAADEYFQSKNIAITSQLANAKHIECPATRPRDAINGTVDTKISPVVATSPTEQGAFEEGHVKMEKAAEAEWGNKVDEVMEKNDDVAKATEELQTDIRPRTPSPPPPPPPLMEELPPPPPPPDVVHDVVSTTEVVREVKEVTEVTAVGGAAVAKRSPSPEDPLPTPPPSYNEAKPDFAKDDAEPPSLPVAPVLKNEIASSTPDSPTTPVATAIKEEDRQIHRSVIELAEGPGTAEKTIQGEIAEAGVAGGAVTVLSVGPEATYTDPYPSDSYHDDPYPHGQVVPTTLVSAYPVNTVETVESHVTYVDPHYTHNVQVGGYGNTVQSYSETVPSYSNAVHSYNEAVPSYGDAVAKSTVVVVNSVDEVDHHVPNEVSVPAPDVHVSPQEVDGVHVITTYQEPGNVEVERSVVERSVEVEAPKVATDHVDEVVTVVSTQQVVDVDLPQNVEVTHGQPEIDAQVNHVSPRVEIPSITVDEVNNVEQSKTVEVVTTEITETREHSMPINNAVTTVVMTQPTEPDMEVHKQKHETVVTEIVTESEPIVAPVAEACKEETRTIMTTETHTVTHLPTEHPTIPEPPAPTIPEPPAPTIPEPPAPAPAPTSAAATTTVFAAEASKPSPTVNNNVSPPGLSPGLSAAQLREQLRNKKKQDPRKTNMSLQEKKAIYDSL